MAQLFHTYLYNPIFEALVFIYEQAAFHDLGLAIIFLTIAVRIVLFPLFYKGAKDQTIMQRLQPEIRRIQSELKTKKEEQARALFALYKENKINPLSGFFLLLIQLPVIIALYQVFLKGLGNAVFDNKSLLGLIDLSAKSLPLAFLAAGLQYIQAKMSLPPKSPSSDAAAGRGKSFGATQDKRGGAEEHPMAAAGRTMAYISPVLTFFILVYLPGALGLYWGASTTISILQQIYINKKLKHGHSAGESKKNTGAHGISKSPD